MCALLGSSRRFSTRLGFLGLAWLANPIAAQPTGTVHGTVRSTEGQPIHTAQVSIAGTTLGAITNQDGRYVIDRVPVGTYTVLVQILGFASGQREDVTVATDQQAVVDFELRTMALSLSEIIVTGVTEATSRARLPFTVARVGRAEMPVVPLTAVSAIQGRVAGATVIQSPQPGDAPSIVLRTPTSVNRENSPLIVVDGTILTQSSADLSSLDIESIEVVKGAAAASLYGSRAAAGVIQIRTTRGSSFPENQTRFSVRTEYGFNDIPREIRWARNHPYQLNENGQFVDAEGQVVQRQNAVLSQYGFQDGAYPGPIYNQVKSLFNPGPFATYSASLGFNGGSTSWLATGSYHHTQGVTLELDGYKRADFRINLDHRLRNDVSFSGSFFHLRSTQDDAFGGAFFDFIQIAPDVNLLEPDPDGTRYAFQPDDSGVRPNPLYGFATQTHQDKRQRTLASIDLRYNPIPWLSFDVNGSYDRSDRNNVDYVPRGVKTSDNPDGDPGSLARFSGLTSGINASGGIAVNRSLGMLTSRTTLRALLEREDNESITATGQVFSVGGLPDLDAALTSSISSNETAIRSTGYFLTSDIDYADRYILSGLVRRDGSSLFGAEERWHTYYRASAAYRMAAESWWPIPEISEFKLRYSRGTAGGRPNFADRFEVFTVQTGGGLELNTLGNPFLKPEHSTEQEFGLDLVALGRYSLQLTHARQTTTDQLIQVPLPRIYGYGTRWENAGTVEGRTYEGTLEARLITLPDVRWSVTAIADRSRNKITEYNRPCHTDGISWRCAGETLGMMYGQKFWTSFDELPEIHANSHDAFALNDDGLLVPVGAGNQPTDGVSRDLWGTTVTIDGVNYAWGMPQRVRDASGNIVRMRIGDSNPDFHWGLANHAQWKALSLYVLVDGQVGGDIYNSTKQRMYQWWRSGDEDQAGKPEELKKPITYYSGSLYNGNTDNNWFVEDASFVKLREVSLRYNLDATRVGPLAKVGVERAILSLIARNLHTWTSYSGYDPELGGAVTRNDNFTFPVYRTLTATIDLVF